MARVRQGSLRLFNNQVVGSSERFDSKVSSTWLVCGKGTAEAFFLHRRFKSR